MRSVAFSPDGKTVVSGSDDKSLKVWIQWDAIDTCDDAAFLELLAEKQSAHSDCINSVAFSPDGKTIVSGSDDQTLKVWDAGASALTPSNPQPKTYRPVLAAASLELEADNDNAHISLVLSVAFSPDGKTIVSGSSYQTLKVWDAGASALTPSNPWPILDRPCACGSVPGAQGGEGECTQRLRALSGLLARRQDHRVRLR